MYVADNKEKMDRLMSEREEGWYGMENNESVRVVAVFDRAELCNVSIAVQL